MISFLNIDSAADPYDSTVNITGMKKEQKGIQDDKRDRVKGRTIRNEGNGGKPNCGLLTLPDNSRVRLVLVCLLPHELPAWCLRLRCICRCRRHRQSPSLRCLSRPQLEYLYFGDSERTVESVPVTDVVQVSL